MRINGHLLGSWSKNIFLIEDTPQSNQSFGIKSINPPAEEIPTGHYVYDQVGSQWIKENARLPVETNDFAGLYFTQPIRQLTVKVGPVELPVVSVLRDLAVLGIPEDLPAGVHELTLEVDGQTLTLKDALEKITPAVQPTHEPTPPPSSYPTLSKKIRVHNVEGDDEARVYINGELKLTAHQGEDIEWDLDEYMTPAVFSHEHANEIIFEYENRGGGYTLGFEYESDSQQAFYHEQGKAGVKNVVDREGHEDQRQGIVFRERLLVHQFNYPIGSGKAWFKVYNLDDGEEVELFATDEVGDIQWNTSRVAKPGRGGEWVKQLPYKAPLECEGYVSRYESDDCFGPSLDSPSTYFSNGNGGTYSYGFEMYRGIYKVFHVVQGQPLGYGAKDSSTAESDYNLPYVSYPVYNHNPFYHPWWLD